MAVSNQSTLINQRYTGPERSDASRQEPRMKAKRIVACVFDSCFYCTTVALTSLISGLIIGPFSGGCTWPVMSYAFNANLGFLMGLPRLCCDYEGIIGDQDVTTGIARRYPACQCFCDPV